MYIYHVGISSTMASILMNISASRSTNNNIGFLLAVVTHTLNLSSSLMLLHASSMRHRCCPFSSTAHQL